MIGVTVVTIVKSIEPSAVPGQLAGVAVKVAWGVGFTFAWTVFEVQTHPESDIALTLYFVVSTRFGVVKVLLVSPEIAFQTVPSNSYH